MNYYNELDPKAAEWLRTLMFYDLIAYGDVDTRSIEDVRPSDLKGYTQCHFFAGIGVWSYALRLAGWSDNRRVWTGSRPCQPFSAAGKGAGASDERHLWPAWFHLIEHAKPREVPIFGEQVASPAALAWLDLVCADMEAKEHTVRAVDLCAAGAGAPHIRQRLYWVADDQGSGRREERADAGRLAARDRPEGRPAGLESGGGDQRLADDDDDGCGAGARAELHDTEYHAESRSELGDAECAQEARQRPHGGEMVSQQESEGSGLPSRHEYGLADSSSTRLEVLGEQQARDQCAAAERGGAPSFWADPEWIYCRDNKWRPVEPGTFPLSHGSPARVGRLRGYGNAIVAPLAAEFIKAYMSDAPAL